MQDTQEVAGMTIGQKAGELRVEPRKPPAALRPQELAMKATAGLQACPDDVLLLKRSLAALQRVA